MEIDMNTIRELLRKIIKQKLEKIINEGHVEITTKKIANINVESKESLRAAVKLSILKPFRTGEKAEYNEKHKKELIAILNIYDEIFDEVYSEYMSKNGFNKISNIVQKMNNSNQVDSSSIVDKIVEQAQKNHPIPGTYDERN